MVKMLEIYSKGVTVASNADVPLNTVALIKGTSTVPLGASSIQLTKCGIYKVTVSGSVIGSAAGVVTLQMEKNGVAEPAAITTITAADATSLNAIGFTTLVQVPSNNNLNCPCATSTTISFRNTGIAATYNTIDVVVTRV